MSKKQNLNLESLSTFSQESDKKDARAFAHLMRREVQLPERNPESDELDVDQIVKDAYDAIDAENNQVDT